MYYISVLFFHYTVENVFTALYALNFNVKEVCIKVWILDCCKEVYDSRQAKNSV